MRCLSVHEPWATALVHGYKTIETRTWSPPVELLDQWIAIHASKAMSDQDRKILAEWGNLAFDRQVMLTVAHMLKHGSDHMLKHGSDHRGCIIGAVQLDGCRRFSREEWRSHWRRHRCPDAWWNPDAWGWFFKEFFAVHPPIPWRGCQRLFEVPFEVDPRIAEEGAKQVHGLVRIGGGEFHAKAQRGQGCQGVSE